MTQETAITLPDEPSIAVLEKDFPLWKKRLDTLLSNKLAVVGLLGFMILLLFAIIGPWLTPYTYYETHLPLANLAPSKQFWFGTDELGRDLFTRVWWGARISLCVGISAATIDLVIGVIYGSLAGLLGDRFDMAMMRIADILHSLPYLLLVILLIVIMGSGMLAIITALSITGWVNMARIMRAQVMQLKEMDYIKAAVALGASKRRILFTHLIPNAFGPMITTMALTIPYAIFSEAFLSFLGLGIQAPFASWGTMANDGLPALSYYPWRLFFPAAMISLTMLFLNMLSDGLRDAFDPRIAQ